MYLRCISYVISILFYSVIYILIQCIKVVFYMSSSILFYSVFYILIYCISFWMQTMSRHFKVLLAIYLIPVSRGLKKASNKPKHVAVFC